MQRILSLDLARGFTVLFIPIVHTVMMYGNAVTHSSGFAKFLAFIAEWPGAQVFMVLLGISFTFSSKRSFRDVFVRVMVLLIFGYGLNVLKFSAPLPAAFLKDMNVDSWWRLIFVGDIFHLAAVSLLVLWLVQKFTDPTLTALLFLALVVFMPASGHPPRVFFPLFPWLVYPLAGFAMGESIKEHGSKAFNAFIFIGLGLFLSGFVGYAGPDYDFYTPGPFRAIMHLGFVVFWLGLWHLFSKFPSNLFYEGLQFLSKRITIIYIIQWPLIFWLMPVFGYHKLPLLESIVIGVDISLVVVLITWSLQQFFAARSSLAKNSCAPKKIS